MTLSRALECIRHVRDFVPPRDGSAGLSNSLSLVAAVLNNYPAVISHQDELEALLAPLQPFLLEIERNISCKQRWHASELDRLLGEYIEYVNLLGRYLE